MNFPVCILVNAFRTRSNKVESHQTVWEEVTKFHLNVQIQLELRENRDSGKRASQPRHCQLAETMDVGGATVRNSVTENLLAQILPNLLSIMMGNAIVEYFWGRLYENPLIRTETLNSVAGIDFMGKYYFAFVGIIKSYLFHDIYHILLSKHSG